MAAFIRCQQGVAQVFCEDFEWALRADPAHWQTANQVLLALARLAAEDGGNDREAALVLAWLMLPAAATVARQYQDGDPDIDAIVAGQLFIQVRTYPWRTRPGSVGAGIGRDLRRHVGRELGIQSGQRLVAVDPVVLDTQPADPEQGEVAEVAVAALLDDAERAGAIDAGQRQLLEDVLAQADALSQSKKLLADTLAKRAKKSKKMFLSARSKTKKSKAAAKGGVEMTVRKPLRHDH